MSDYFNSFWENGFLNGDLDEANGGNGNNNGNGEKLVSPDDCFQQGMAYQNGVCVKAPSVQVVGNGESVMQDFSNLVKSPYECYQQGMAYSAQSNTCVPWSDHELWTTVEGVQQQQAYNCYQQGMAYSAQKGSCVPWSEHELWQAGGTVAENPMYECYQQGRAYSPQKMACVPWSEHEAHVTTTELLAQTPDAWKSCYFQGMLYDPISERCQAVPQLAQNIANCAMQNQGYDPNTDKCIPWEQLKLAIQQAQWSKQPVAPVPVPVPVEELAEEKPDYNFLYFLGFGAAVFVLIAVLGSEKK